jgi:LuxR family transcriptional regulator, maltose regulon positive regulatory protein
VTTIAEPTHGQAAVPVLATKLRRPSTPLLLIDRPRLLDQLAAYLDRRLVLVSAPAGYGKTALISHWLASAGGAYAWLSLDEQDNDPATFLLYLLAAIRGAYPETMAAVEQLLRAPTLLPPIQLADAVHLGMAAIPGPLVLALDDYHVIKAPEIHAFMARLIEHLPAQVQLVLVTRSDPPLPLERLRGRQQLGETRAADLRFTGGETRLLLQRMLGPDVSDETVALLEASTEGWAVGLHLAGLSLRQRSDPAVFARKIAEHGHQAVTEYLLSEVLAGLPQAQADCLLQSSLFDRFCAPLIDAAQAAGGVKLAGEDFLLAIRRGNLFVVSLDDEGAWFRYHHFFQALLRARLGQRYADADIKAMHGRGAAWFAGQGLVDEAVSHFLKAGDAAAAARLVEAQVHPALDRENWRRIEHWIRLLPLEMLRRPRLLTAQAWLHVLRYQFTAAGPLLDAAEAGMLADPPAVRGWENLVRGEISVLRSMIAYYQSDYRRTVELTEAALGLLRPETLYATGQASLYHIWGLQGTGADAAAIEFAHRQLEAYGLRANAFTLRVLLVLVNTYYEMADLPRMEESAAVFQEMARQSGLGASLAWVHYMHGWLQYQRNELAAAEKSYRELASMSAVAHAKALVDGHVGLALTALAKGCPDDAVSAVAALRQRLIERDMLAFTAVAASLEQRVALAIDPASSLQWRPNGGSPAVPGDFWEQPQLTQVRTFLAAGSPDDLAQAAELLADSRAKALARRFTRRLIELGGLQALVLSAQGQEAAALAALQEAVEAAAPGGALRLLADSGSGLVPLLRELQAAGVAPRYVTKVLAALGEPPDVPALSPMEPRPATPAPRAEAPAEILTNREIDVLILLAQRLPDKEIAARLVLSLLTVKKHEQRIYRKLGVDNRRAAVAEARRRGLI